MAYRTTEVGEYILLLLQFKPTKCTLVQFNFTTLLLLLSGHDQEVSCRIQALWYNVMSKYIRYYDESPMFVISWSRYTGIIIKVIIEHVKVNINMYIKHKYLVFTIQKIVK
jgi:hypothetical protein